MTLRELIASIILKFIEAFQLLIFQKNWLDTELTTIFLALTILLLIVGILMNIFVFGFKFIVSASKLFSKLLGSNYFLYVFFGIILLLFYFAHRYNVQ